MATTLAEAAARTLSSQIVTQLLEAGHIHSGGASDVLRIIREKIEETILVTFHD